MLSFRRVKDKTSLILVFQDLVQCLSGLLDLLFFALFQCSLENSSLSRVRLLGRSEKGYVFTSQAPFSVGIGVHSVMEEGTVYSIKRFMGETYAQSQKEAEAMPYTVVNEGGYAAKNWDLADAIRDQLKDLGLTIEDTAAGTRIKSL